MAEPGPLESNPRQFFDAHCDTVIKMLDEGADFVGGTESTHIDYPRLRSAGVRAQVFACFVLSERYPEQEAERAEAMLATLEEAFATIGEGMRIARTSDDLGAAFEGGPIAAVVGLEGADPLCGKAESLRPFFESGVRDVIFAWKDNPFSGTAFGENTPLTREGERLVGLSEELGVMVEATSAVPLPALAHIAHMITPGMTIVLSLSGSGFKAPQLDVLAQEVLQAQSEPA